MVRSFTVSGGGGDASGCGGGIGFPLTCSETGGTLSGVSRGGHWGYDVFRRFLGVPGLAIWLRQ